MNTRHSAADARHGATDQHPRIYAHRGSALLAPENTQAAFDLALDFGSDVLETDVRISADQQVIVTHDADLERTTNGRGKVRQQSLSYLKKLDAGYHAKSVNGERFRAQGIELMTLDEMFLSYPNRAINIDIKDNDTLAARLVAELVIKHKRLQNTVVGSFHPKILLYLRELAPSIRTAAVQPEVARLFLHHLPLPNRIPEMNFCAVQIPISYKLIPLATARFIQHVQRQGKEVCFWTVNNPAKMRQLLKLGADGIVTDRPDLALQVFRELGLRRP